MRHSVLAATVFAMFSVCAPVLAQVSYQPITWILNGDTPAGWFGFSVKAAGDVNGDGIPDIIAGEPYDHTNGSHAGAAHVFSGATGATLYIFYGDSEGDFFGWSVSGAGDVNGDGFDDLIVGAPSHGFNGDNSGSARVFSGLDGSILFTCNGDSASDQFGFSVSGAGDVNGDGFDDLFVGAPFADIISGQPGSARVFSGATGAILHTFSGDSADDWFGFSVSDTGDVNGDGVFDLIVGAPLDDNNGDASGSARVFSGATGVGLFAFDGDSAGDWFGHAVNSTGDVNGDGVPDLIVGAPGDINIISNPGRARVFNGLNGAILHSFIGVLSNDKFGYSVSGAGDVNNDGFADIIIGAPHYKPGSNQFAGLATVFSGATGLSLNVIVGERVQFVGHSVSGAGDLNGDGFADVIITAPGPGIPGGGPGRVRVYISTNGAWPAAAPPAPCPGNANDDAIVNFDDINAVIANWLTTCP